MHIWIHGVIAGIYAQLTCEQMGGKKELVTGYSRGQTIERVPRTSSATQSCPIEKPVCMQLQLKIAYFTATRW